jgi:hypothetical protein
MDNRLQLDASAFHIDWQNIQTQIRLAACGSTLITNLGKATSNGFDTSLSYRVIDDLRLGLAVGYAGAHLTQTIRGPSGATYGFSGDQIGGPPWNGDVSGEYRYKVLGGHDAYARADYQYTGTGARPDLAVAGADPQARGSEAYRSLSLRAGFYVGGWDISAFINNALNEAPILLRERDTTTSPLFYELTIRPRTVGVQARTKL